MGKLQHVFNLSSNIFGLQRSDKVELGSAYSVIVLDCRDFETIASCSPRGNVIFLKT